jgi:hypothetical protein
VTTSRTPAPGRFLDGRAAAVHIAAWDPARVLAEISAKRAIVDAYVERAEDLTGGYVPVPIDGMLDGLMTAMLAHVRLYAGRSDFPDDWKEGQRVP